MTIMSMSHEDGILAADLYVGSEFKCAGVKETKTGRPRGRFDAWANTKDLDEVRDIVEPTAFTKTLPSFFEFPNLLFMHDFTKQLGMVAEAEVRDEGLWYEGEVFLDTTLGADTWALMEGGALRASSIGFNLPVDGFKIDDQRNARVITKLDLFEISIVNLPANRMAKIISVGKQMRNWATAQTKFQLGSIPDESGGLAADSGDDKRAALRAQMLRRSALAAATVSGAASSFLSQMEVNR